MFLLSLDGLQASDFEALQERMPALSRIVDNGFQAALDCGVLTSATAIWAELLSGVRWKESGICAQASPRATLNELKPVTEDDLFSPIKLLSGANVIANIPLTKPTAAGGAWLSDGTIPVPQRVAPAWLAEREPFREYHPRSFSSLIETRMGTLSDWVDKCIRTEIVRIECAEHLIDTFDGSRYLVRLSVFDELSHLLGSDFLSTRELQVDQQISSLLSRLNDFIEKIASRFSSFAIVSAFSHASCEARFSLNDLLCRGGFLRYGQLDATAARRAYAVAMLGAGKHSEMNTELGQMYFQPHRQQSLFDCSHTIAASPVAGCIYLNYQNRFTNGIVQPEHAQEVRDCISSHLRHILEPRFGDELTIWTSDRVHGADPSLLPDILVYIPGVEFHNTPDDFFSPTDVPRTVHSPQGFIWCSDRSCPSQVSAHEVCDLLLSA